MKLRYLSLFAPLLLSACASLEPARFSDGALTAPNGMTLYVFDKDSPNKSTCYMQCATNWPPFLAEDGAQASGNYSLVQRSDGKQIWAYKGRPLYFWSKDMKPGDKTGEGVNKVWWTVKP